MLSGSGKAHESGAAITWGPLAAILLTVIVYALSQLLVGLSFGIFFDAAKWTDLEVENWLTSTGGQFAFMLASATVTLGIVWLFLHSRKTAFRVLGFERPPRWTDVAYVVAGFVVYFALFILAAIIASGVFGVDTGQEQEIGFESAKTHGEGLLLVFVSLVVLPPIVEEILFRGFLFRGLRKHLTFLWATLITSVMFAMPHLLGSTSGLLWIAAVDTFVLSLVLCYMRERTGALWACIGLHAVKNGIAFLYIFVA